MNKQKHSDRAHAVLAPSAADRWMTCPGSLILSKEIPPQPPGRHAEQGTIAHEYAEMLARAILQGDHDAFEAALEALSEDDRVEDVQEMSEHVTNYAMFVKEIYERFRAHLPKHEHTMYLEKTLRYNDSMWGTGDCVHTAVGETTEILLIDYKHGRGVEVDADDNLQLISYALAAENTFGIKADRIRMFIYQPRIPGRRLPYVRATLEGEKLAQMRAQVASTVSYAATVLKDGVATEEDFEPGEHCRFCPAKPICKAFATSQRDANLDLLVENITVPELPVLSMDQLIKIQSRKKQIEGFLDSVEAYLTQRLENGFDVPGYKIVKSNPRRSWDKEISDKDWEKAVKKLGMKEPFAKKRRGIGEVEKAVGKGMIGDLTVLSEPRNQLVPIEDGREAIGKDDVVLLTELS